MSTATMGTARMSTGLVGLIITLLGCSLCAADPTAAEPLRAGFAVVDITPPVGWRKGGGLSEVVSTGIHDPLYAKAIVLEQNHTLAALVICDLHQIPEPLSSPTRREIEQATGIPFANIVLLATHNHGGPEFYGPMRNAFHERALSEQGHDPREPLDYLALLRERIGKAVTAAKSKLAPVTMEILRTRQEGLAFNRRFHMQDGTVRTNPGKRNVAIERPAGPVDPDLPFILFRNAADGQPRGGLTLFAMHVAVFGGTEFGADFPAFLERGLRQKLGPEFVCLFGEGCAGDVNHINTATADPDPSPEEIGQRLSDTILAALPELKPVAPARLAARSVLIPAPLRDQTTSDVTRARAVMDRLGRQPTDFLLITDAWRVMQQAALRDRFGDTLPNELQAFRLADDVAIVTLPHEVFVELGLEIRRRSPFAHTLVMTLAQDVDFYIPTERAFAEGGYEVLTSPLKPGIGEQFVEAAVKLLTELKPAAHD
jgi:hypothetical protein